MGQFIHRVFCSIMKTLLQSYCDGLRCPRFAPANLAQPLAGLTCHQQALRDSTRAWILTNNHNHNAFVDKHNGNMAMYHQTNFVLICHEA